MHLLVNNERTLVTKEIWSSAIFNVFMPEQHIIFLMMGSDQPSPQPHSLVPLLLPSSRASYKCWPIYSPKIHLWAEYGNVI